MIILYVLEFLGLLILLLLALLLFVPFNYLFLGRKYETALVKSNVSWLFGLVKLIYRKSLNDKDKLVLQVFGLNFKLKTSRNPDKFKEKSKKEKRKGKNKRFFNKNFIKAVLKAFMELFHHIKPRRFYLEGRFGFEDPYFTGIASAVLNILHPKLQQYRISAHMVFDEEIFEGKVFISGRLILIKAAFIALKLYLNKSVRSVLKFKEEKSYVN